MKKQALVDQFIRDSKNPIIFVGHHIEADQALRLNAPVRLLLKVSPRTAAVRRYKKYNYSTKRLKKDISIGKDDVNALKSHGYVSIPPKQVYNLIVNWSKQMKG